MSPFDATTTARGPHRVDTTVVIRGAAGGLLIAMVAAIANVILAAQNPKPAVALNLTLVGLFLGFVLAGFVAGYDAPGEVARHGAYAGLVAFVPVEVVGILGRLDRGDPISIFSIVLLAFLAAAGGLAGAAPGAKRGARRRGGHGDPNNPNDPNDPIDPGRSPT